MQVMPSHLLRRASLRLQCMGATIDSYKFVCNALDGVCGMSGPDLEAARIVKERISLWLKGEPSVEDYVRKYHGGPKEEAAFDLYCATMRCHMVGDIYNRLDSEGL